MYSSEKYSKNAICQELNITKKEKKRIKVTRILGIVSDNSSYKINCKIHKRLNELTIERFFLHSREEQFTDIIKSNDTPWSGCVQQGEIIINEKLYKFGLNLGGFGYINSKDNKEDYYSCYHIGCPKLANFEYSIYRINNPTYKSLYSFCKSIGIKESKIRALNPWINKKATNIPPNAEIIIPNNYINN